MQRLGALGWCAWVVPVTWLMTWLMRARMMVPVTWSMQERTAPQIHKIEQNVAPRDCPAQGIVPNAAASGLIDGRKQSVTQRWPCSRQISPPATPPAARSASYRPAYVRPER
jgi:hypothetical protein